MTSTFIHNVARSLVVAILVISAWPTIDSAVNPHHLDMARALLSGSIWIHTPTTVHDVGAVGEVFYTPFPPLPALLAVPAVLTPWPDAVFNVMIVAAAAWAVFLAGRLGDRWGGRATGTWAAVALGLGSGLWTATAIHDTYHSAHVLAVLAVVSGLYLATGRRRRPVAAGLSLGLGALARQAVGLAAVPLAALASGRWSTDRGRRAAVGVVVAVAIPVSLYLVLNAARFGSPLETGYDRVHHHPRITADLEAHGAFSPAFVPRNVRLMLVGGPLVIPVAPFLVPNPAGMSVLLVSPWLIFALLPLLRPDRPQARRRAAWCWLTVLFVSVPHLLYVNSGWVQFGYRFALDWLPFLLFASILGIRRLSWLTAAPPLALAVFVNAWGMVALANWERWSAFLR
jgi:hypothetical protein